MHLPTNTLFFTSDKGAKGFHYPQFDTSGARYNEEPLPIIEELFYVNRFGLHALRVDLDEMNKYNLSNNTIWVTNDEYRRIRT